MSRWASSSPSAWDNWAACRACAIVGNLRAQPQSSITWVCEVVSRSSLARVNAQQPYTLYQALFGRLLARCQQRAPRHGFRSSKLCWTRRTCAWRPWARAHERRGILPTLQTSRWPAWTLDGSGTGGDRLKRNVRYQVVLWRPSGPVEDFRA